MFQFTTTTVINSNKDLTTGKPLWSSQESQETGSSNFYVKRVNNFKKENVVAIYKAEAKEAELAKITMDLSQVNGTEGEVYRFSIYIGLSQESQDSRYSNDMIVKGKPFSIDFVWKGTAETVAKNLATLINKYDLLVYGDKLLNVSYSGTFITIEATNEYQRFKKVNIEKFDEKAHFGMGEYNVIRSLQNLLDEGKKKKSNAEVTNTEEGYFRGKEGFGTYSFLLHNLRLPTSARTHAFAINQDETPIVGAMYNQYTIHYCVNRGPLGMNAVGDTVKSVTTHVFYVLKSLSADFEAALNTVAPAAGIIEAATEATHED